MGSSWSRFLPTFAKQEARVLIWGLDAAGKTTILYVTKLGEVVTTIPTIGFNVETIQYRKLTLTAWDVGGRDKIRPLWRHYYANTSGLVFVVDSNDLERIGEARDELHKLSSEDELRDLPILIFANKQDLPNAASVEVLKEKLDLSKFDQRKIRWHIQPSSATQKQGITEGFQWLVDACQKKIDLKSPIIETIKDTEVMKNDLTGFWNSLTFKTMLSKFI